MAITSQKDRESFRCSEELKEIYPAELIDEFGNDTYLWCFGGDIQVAILDVAMAMLYGEDLSPKKVVMRIEKLINLVSTQSYGEGMYGL